MQDEYQDNGEFPISDNPESNQTSYDDEADARDSRTFQVADHGIAPSRFPGTGAPGVRRFFRWRECRGSIISMDDDHFTLRDFFLWCGVPVLIVLLIRIFAVGFYEIPSRSMMDTMVPGDRVVTSKLAQDLRSAARRRRGIQRSNNWLNEEQSSAPVAGTSSSD